MKSQPLLTVIVPAYNTGLYLHQCLDSLCQQSYRTLEIICVDDESTDDTLSIMEEYRKRDERIIVLSVKHGGLGAARNAALDIAHGEWVIGLDSDDWLQHDAYERVMAHAADDVDAVFFSAEPVCNQKDEESLRKLRQYSQMYTIKERHKVALKPHQVMTDCQPSFCLGIRRRSLIEKYQLRFTEHIHEDEDFLLHYMGHAKKVTFLKDRLYKRLIRAGSITQTPNKVMLEDLMPGFVERAYKHYRESGILDSHWEIIEDFLLHKGYYLKMNGDATQLRIWRENVEAMAQRSGMAKDVRFSQTLAEVNGKEIIRAIHMKLFRILPILKQSSTFGKWTRYYLFGCLLLTSTYGGGKIAWKLFGKLPIPRISRLRLLN